MSECYRGLVNTFYLHPREFGLTKTTLEALKGEDAVANAEIARSVLGGNKGPLREIVLLNAGAGLFIAGHADSVRVGVELAGQAIDSGRAKETLEKMVELSNA